EPPLKWKDGPESYAAALGNAQIGSAVIRNLMWRNPGETGLDASGHDNSGNAAPNTAFDKHAEELKFRTLRWRDENGEIPPDGLWRALEHRRQALANSAPLPTARKLSSPAKHNVGPSRPSNAGIQTNGWTWLGPGNIGGRVRSILVHPTLTN